MPNFDEVNIVNAADEVIISIGPNREIKILASNGTTALNFIGQAGTNGAWLEIGDRTNPGRIILNDRSGEQSIQMLGEYGTIRLGKGGNSGKIVITDQDGADNIQLIGEERRILLKNDNNEPTILLDGDGGNLRLGGGNNQNGNILIFDKSVPNDSDPSLAAVHLRGSDGDIVLKNADFAEDFDVQESLSTKVEPGTLMILNEDGKLIESSKAYDKKVAGIVSGAGDYKPGIIMDKKPNLENRLPIALVGKVMCKVDASFGSIQVGDLLTSSPTMGHAMKADDPTKAFGSVIGKALGVLKEGKGLVPVLVSLQ